MSFTEKIGLAIASGLAFVFLFSFIESFTWRVIQAFYSPRRKQIAEKWRFILGERSCCEHCGHALGPVDLIPVLGYYIRSGRCRYCGKPIPSRIIWGEVLAFGYGLALGLLHPDFVYLAFSAAYLFVGFLILRVDREYYLIPPQASLSLIFIAATEFLMNHSPLQLRSDLQGLMILFNAIFWFAVFYLTARLAPHSMGQADSFVVGGCALALSTRAAFLLVPLAAGLGILFFLAVVRNKKSAYKDKGLKTKLPFGVFLVIAFWLLRLTPSP